MGTDGNRCNWKEQRVTQPSVPLLYHYPVVHFSLPLVSCGARHPTQKPVSTIRPFASHCQPTNLSTYTPQRQLQPTKAKEENNYCVVGSKLVSGVIKYSVFFESCPGPSSRDQGKEGKSKTGPNPPHGRCIHTQTPSKLRPGSHGNRRNWKGRRVSRPYRVETDAIPVSCNAISRVSCWRSSLVFIRNPQSSHQDLSNTNLPIPPSSSSSPSSFVSSIISLTSINIDPLTSLGSSSPFLAPPPPLSCSSNNQ